MKNHFLFFLAFLPFMSCKSAGRIFGDNKTPHEAYASKIEDKPEGKQWIDLSKNVLASPQSIQLPYSLTGQFPAGKPRALALGFNAKRGEKIRIEMLETTSLTGIYADIFRVNGDEAEHLLAADAEQNSFEFDIEEQGQYILRLQPGIENTIQYSLIISAGPSLGFPVAGNKARVGSVWGDSRDNGKRSHEGIDIFAAKLTPVIAAADGYISSVRDGGLGGKTVNLKVRDRNLSLYYAHLDKQLVREGDEVKKGDTLGLVGNTGNARTTPPHLHFGIYTYGGAIDPLPFVNKTVKPAPLAPTAKDVGRQLQLVKPLTVKNGQPLKVNTILVSLAATTNGYLAELPDGTIITVPQKSVKVLTNSKA